MLWASRQREGLKEAWANADLVASFKNEHIVKHAGAQGYCNAMQELMNITAEDLENKSD
jgi:hypothetical protein